MNFGIIAAGEGSRLVQEGVSYPKPLVPLCGRPMIGRLLDIFAANGAEKICVVINDRMPEVARWLEDETGRMQVRIETVVKSTPSSMHSFYELGRLLDDGDRFIVTTVDTIFDPEEFSRYVGAYAGAPSYVDGMMALTSYIDDEKPLYVDIDGDDNITAFRDKATETTRLVSGGIYGLGPDALRVLDQCMEKGMSRMRNFQRTLVDSGLKIKGYEMGKILDVDHAEDIRKAEVWLITR